MSIEPGQLHDWNVVASHSSMTVLDVWDHAFGGRAPQSRAEVEELLELLDQFWSANRPPERRDVEIRLTTTGASGSEWVLDAAAACIEPLDRWGRRQKPGPSSDAARVSAAAMLTADVVVCADPLFDLFHFYEAESSVIGGEHDYVDVATAYYTQLVQSRPLIEAGLLLIVPSDRQARADYGRLRALAMDGALVPDVELDRARARSVLATAEYADAAIVPVGKYGWTRLLSAGVVQRPTPASRVSAPRIAEGLAHLDLPLLVGLGAKTFVRVHREEPAFTEWREDLREAARAVLSLPPSEHFEEECRAIYGAHLARAASRARRQVSRSGALRAALAAEPLQTVLGAVSAGSAAMAMGGSGATAAASAAAGGLARVAYAVAKKPTLTGSAAIMSLLASEHERR